MLLVDDVIARTFEPFATSRPLGEMRVGAILVRERWARVLGVEARAAVTSAHLDGFAEFDAPPMWPALSTALDQAGSVWVINTRAIPAIDHDFNASRASDCIIIGDKVAAVRLAPAVVMQHAPALERGEWPFVPETWSQAQRVTTEGLWLHEVWDIIGNLVALLGRDIPAMAPIVSAATLDPSEYAIRGEHPVFVEPGATVEPMVLFDTTAGPVLLRRGSHVQAFTRVVGPCYVGVDTTITTDRIAASAIGDVCRVHGELSTSVLIGHSNKGHDGFVGHSILGRWVNLGAGTITSNLKNTYGSVAMWTPDGVRDTGQQFLGTLFGDHAKTGIGLRLTTGCVIGTGANVFDRMPPKAVQPFAWGTGSPYQVFEAPKFLDTASRMMARRHILLADAQRDWWARVHGYSAQDLRWPRD
ncbi:MAG: hypothetical protein IBJ03_19255 [Gemmatimonadaceae bacterium]|nr:hypothetical protein [Gemmatimonadaceae bacterium]